MADDQCPIFHPYTLEESARLRQEMQDLRQQIKILTIEIREMREKAKMTRLKINQDRENRNKA